MRVFRWFNDNAPALQALGGFLSFLIACVTVPVLFRTMKVAREAAEAAKEQAFAAKAQVAAADEASRVSQLQLVAAQDAAAAEREHSALIKQHTLATLRPVLVFSKRLGSAFTQVMVENQTEALALDVRGWNGTPEDPGIEFELGQGILGGNAETYTEGIDWGPYEVGSTGHWKYLNLAPAFLRYRSQDGRKFVTVLENLHARPLKQLLREEI